MKSYEFIKNLNEDIEPDYQGGPSKEKLTVNDGLLEEIEIECSNAIVSMRNASKFLYRGIDISSSQAYPFRSTTRTNRMPKDTPHELKDAFNDIMYICRIRTNRSNSIFSRFAYKEIRSVLKMYWNSSPQNSICRFHCINIITTIFLYLVNDKS